MGYFYSIVADFATLLYTRGDIPFRGWNKSERFLLLFVPHLNLFDWKYLSFLALLDHQLFEFLDTNRESCDNVLAPVMNGYC